MLTIAKNVWNKNDLYEKQKYNIKNKTINVTVTHYYIQMQSKINSR